MFFLYFFDRLAHKLGYNPSMYHRTWWCERAEDKLTEIAIRHRWRDFDNGTEHKCRCFWCRRYHVKEYYDDT